jgi:hypothetical protein
VHNAETESAAPTVLRFAKPIPTAAAALARAVSAPASRDRSRSPSPFDPYLHAM